MKNEQEQTDDQFLLEQFPIQLSNNSMQTSFDQVQHQTLTSTSSSKSLLTKYLNKYEIISFKRFST